jgi:hypothetical protein
MPMPVGSAYQLGTGTNNYMDVLRKSNWEVILSTPGMGNIALVAANVTVPDTTIGVVDVYHFNEVVHIAGKPAPQKMEIEILDYIGQDIFDSLFTWYQQVYNANTGVIGYASTYKQSGQVNLIDVTGALVRSWYAFGLFPTSAPVPTGQLSYDSMDAVHIKMSLSCDRVSTNNAINQVQTAQ